MKCRCESLEGDCKDAEQGAFGMSVFPLFLSEVNRDQC